MINSTSILTSNFKKLEINQFIHSHLTGLNNLYGFLSYTKNIERTIIAGKVSPTTFRIKTIEIKKGNNSLIVNTKKFKLSDFFVGQKIEIKDVRTPTTKIFTTSNSTAITEISVVDGKITLKFQHAPTEDWKGDLYFIGFNPTEYSKFLTLHNGTKNADGKIISEGIDESGISELSSIENLYTNYLMEVTVSKNELTIPNCLVYNETYTNIEIPLHFVSKISPFLNVNLRILSGDEILFNDVIITNLSGNRLYLNDKNSLYDIQKTKTLKFIYDNVLVYDRNIMEYDPSTFTVKVDLPFDDYPKLSTESFYKIYENSLKKPTYPIDSDDYIKGVHKNIYYMKKLSSADICPVIHRQNWIKNSVYNSYRSNVNMNEKTYNITLDTFAESTTPFFGSSGGVAHVSSISLQNKPKVIKSLEYDESQNYKFYVMNSYLQVFKCVYAPTDAVGKIKMSTDEPIFSPGNYDDKTNIITTDDQYKWKYLYQIPLNKIKFMNDKYMPLIEPPEVENKFGAGCIEAVNIIKNPSKFSINEYKLMVEGDGVGADLSLAFKSDGTIRTVLVKDPGIGYSYAEIFVYKRLKTAPKDSAWIKDVSYELQALISPIGGSGYNLMSELGCENLMVTSEFLSNLPEVKGAPIRQFGIINNPKQKHYTGYKTANNDEYTTCMIVGLGSIDNLVIEQEYYQQDKASDKITFSGICFYIDPTEKFAYFTNIAGMPTKNKSLYRKTDGKRVAQVISLDDVVSPIQKYTGDIIYVQNVQELTSADTVSNFFKIILNY